MGGKESIPFFQSSFLRGENRKGWDGGVPFPPLTLWEGKERRGGEGGRQSEEFLPSHLARGKRGAKRSFCSLKTKKDQIRRGWLFLSERGHSPGGERGETSLFLRPFQIGEQVTRKGEGEERGAPLVLNNSWGGLLHPLSLRRER